jgi:hypothetical protein
MLCAICNKISESNQTGKHEAVNKQGKQRKKPKAESGNCRSRKYYLLYTPGSNRENHDT